MADDPFPLQAFRKSHAIRLGVGGVTRDVVNVRFFLGESGPYDKDFPRDVEPRVIDDYIESERRALQQHVRR